MRALVLEEVDTAPLSKEVDTPTPRAGEALIRVYGAALNLSLIHI